MMNNLLSMLKQKTEKIKTESFLLLGEALFTKIDKAFGRSLFIRVVDSGSCNACEVELASLGNPYYDIERFGVKFVASPRHADIMLVTGCVTRNMLEPMLICYNAMPAPKLVVTCGTCALDGGYFKESYAVEGLAGKLPVAMHIDGCPPEPVAILEALLNLLKQIEAS